MVWLPRFVQTEIVQGIFHHFSQNWPVVWPLDRGTALLLSTFRADYCLEWTTCGLTTKRSKFDYLLPNTRVLHVSAVSLTIPDFIMTNISNRMSNEKFFPTKHNSSFPSNFHTTIVKPLHKQMFRVFAHVYWAHFEVTTDSSLWTNVIYRQSYTSG